MLEMTPSSKRELQLPKGDVDRLLVVLVGEMGEAEGRESGEGGGVNSCNVCLLCEQLYCFFWHKYLFYLSLLIR